jgi:hypothetical protein
MPVRINRSGRKAHGPDGDLRFDLGKFGGGEQEDRLGFGGFGALLKLVERFIGGGFGARDTDAGECAGVGECVIPVFQSVEDVFRDEVPVVGVGKDREDGTELRRAVEMGDVEGRRRSGGPPDLGGVRQVPCAAGLRGRGGLRLGFKARF